MSGESRRAEIAFMLVIVLGAILFAANPAIAPEEKGEKVKINDQGWDRDGQQFVMSMSCKFGIATAGEHAGFSVRATLGIFMVNGNDWDTVKGEASIVKQEGAEKDADGYIKIEPMVIPWDRNGYVGPAEVTATVSLVGPSGKPIGKPSVATEIVSIEPPVGGGPGVFGSIWTAVR